MLVRICSKITERFIHYDILDQELADWCTYWLQKRILTILVVSVMLIVGSLLFGLKSSACFLLGLLPLRRRLSGYHTKSPYSCMIISVGITLLALLLHSTFSPKIAFLFSITNFLICLVLVVYVLGDHADPKLHLTQAEINENHKAAILVLIYESVIGITIALVLHSFECLSACQMGIAVVVLSSVFNLVRSDKEA